MGLCCCVGDELGTGVLAPSDNQILLLVDTLLSVKHETIHPESVSGGEDRLVPGKATGKPRCHQQRSRPLGGEASHMYLEASFVQGRFRISEKR
jgi:hypothetical protein